MTTESTLIFGGYGLVAGWSALATYEGSAMLTFLMRLAASVAILAMLFFALPGANLASFGQAAIFYAMFMAIPVVIGSYLFAFFCQAFGTMVYLVLLALATAAYVATFTAHLKS
jgi:hypothetical protein